MPDMNIASHILPICILQSDAQRDVHLLPEVESVGGGVQTPDDIEIDHFNNDIPWKAVLQVHDGP